ncbi:macro domain-containing protein [Jeotgalibacillus haloalkalitolerans]|uniref:Macro domain-containing protein n=1 Tax=Jeotgalibacillus haloalkalitolerans TaxID=3104292 RepID=A0ABU5KRX1_9BACL|nr:macro domain-containing protein [Jeotgalibacillus sp. HH7-29]MDZ5713475.1 macro domain-containing protein [Jeotgalibacillus sp. HH7-29]
MPFTIIRQDITKLEVDAIVNAANTSLKMGGGVCGAIFRAAGEVELQGACNRLAPIQTGEAVITEGFNLPANYIIHAAGPVYRHSDKENSKRNLHSAYINSLKIAVENKFESVAFPLISSGIYGYPKNEALQVATDAIKEFLADHDISVMLVIYDKSAFNISKELLGSVESYIDENYVEKQTLKRRELLDVEEKDLYTLSESHLNYDDIADAMRSPIEDFVDNLDEPFSTAIIRLIDSKGKTDVEVYKRANLDRRLFSKIRAGKGYEPSKRTAIALAIGLELTLNETDDLLRRAGFALSRSQKFDVVIEYFIKNGKYDIFEINEVLFEYDLPTLGV